MSLSNWPSSERPREKLFNKGATALSDAELIAILLGTGTRGKTAIDLARELLNHFSNLSSLLAADFSEMQSIEGVGQAKFAIFQAIRELSQRSLLEDLCRGDALTSPSATKRYLQAVLGNQQQEVFWALMLDSQHQVLASEALSHGTIDAASVYPREVVKRCLKHNAAAVIFAHNHPSGALTPSESDKAITQKLKRALATVDIRMLDHLIIGHNRCCSMAELGLI